MKINLLLVITICTRIISYSQCDPVSTINEDFTNFNISPDSNFKQNCWSAVGSFAHIAQNGITGNKYVEYYNYMYQNSGAYLISPELSSIDSEHRLSFDVFNQNSKNVVLQLGTLASADMSESNPFIPFGDPIYITENPATYSNIVINVPSSQKFIVFRITSNATFAFAGIDNIKYEKTLNVPNFNKESLFNIFPNPIVDKKNVFIKGNFDEKTNIKIHTVTGTIVYTSEFHNTNKESIDLSFLSSGIYLAKISIGDYTETKKIIIK